jgi:hypothetical protein
MPFTLRPTSTRVSAANKFDPTTRNKYVTSFAFDFTGENSTLQTVAGMQFQGAMCTLNMQQLTGNAQSGPIKALQLTIEFYAGTDEYGNFLFDSDLFIFIPATNQVIRIAPQIISGLQGGTVESFASTCVVTAIVPIASFAPTVIQFIKGNDSSGNTFGNLTVSAFDFKQQPYFATGFSSI